MLDWNTDYHGISINYDGQFVHILTDTQLLKFLGRFGNDSLKLAKHLRETHQTLFGRELRISEESLSVEILIHAYLDVLLRGVGELGKLLPQKALKDLVACMEQLEGKTKIIDCGEKEVDSNRHVFDSLVPYRQFLYMVLGTLA